MIKKFLDLPLLDLVILDPLQVPLVLVGTHWQPYSDGNVDDDDEADVDVEDVPEVVLSLRVLEQVWEHEDEAEEHWRQEFVQYHQQPVELVQDANMGRPRCPEELRHDQCLDLKAHMSIEDYGQHAKTEVVEQIDHGVNLDNEISFDLMRTHE